MAWQLLSRRARLCDAPLLPPLARALVGAPPGPAGSRAAASTWQAAQAAAVPATERSSRQLEQAWPTFDEHRHIPGSYKVPTRGVEYPFSAKAFYVGEAQWQAGALPADNISVSYLTRRGPAN